MKKVWMGLCIFCALLCLCACGEAETTTEAEATSGESEEESFSDYSMVDGVLYYLDEPVDLGITELDLWSLACEDYSFLAEFTELRELTLNDLTITDLSVLENLVNLETLWLEYCADVTDISVLSKLPNLSAVKIGNCPGITDYSVLEGLPLTFLYITHQDLFDNTQVEVIRDMTSLEELGIWATPVTDLSALENLTSLRSLSYGASTATDATTDYTPLGNLTSLTRLNLTRACPPEGDFSALASLTELEVLSLPGGGEDLDLSWLAGMTKMQTLSFGEIERPFSDISVLANMQDLSRVNILYVTPEQYDWLFETFPQCEIVTNVYND